MKNGSNEMQQAFMRVTGRKSNEVRFVVSASERDLLLSFTQRLIKDYKFLDDTLLGVSEAELKNLDEQLKSAVPGEEISMTSLEFAILGSATFHIEEFYPELHDSNKPASVHIGQVLDLKKD